LAGADLLLLEEEKQFLEMLEWHGKVSDFSPNEIGCANLSIVKSLVIFTILHVPWNLKPIMVPRVHIPKIIDLLKEKIGMGILEPSNTLYSNRWFIVSKKNGSIEFIQDLQPVNQVTI
jgi:hypothetical protein